MILGDVIPEVNLSIQGKHLILLEYMTEQEVLVKTPSLWYSVSLHGRDPCSALVLKPAPSVTAILPSSAYHPSAFSPHPHVFSPLLKAIFALMLIFYFNKDIQCK